MPTGVHELTLGEMASCLHAACAEVREESGGAELQVVARHNEMAQRFERAAQLYLQARPALPRSWDVFSKRPSRTRMRHCAC